VEVETNLRLSNVHKMLPQQTTGRAGKYTIILKVNINLMSLVTGKLILLS
jgi:hypothetical protein